MSREPRLDEPDGVDLVLLAERDPNCDLCGHKGIIIGEPITGRVGVRLQCVNVCCPGYSIDDGCNTWEVCVDE